MKQRISQLYNNQNKLVTDPASIANALQTQFVTSFSNPLNSDKVVPEPSPSVDAPELSDFELSTQDILMQ